MTDMHVEMNLEEKQLDSQIVAKGSFLEVRRDTVRLPDGKHGTREYCKHPGAVMIIPILDDGRLVLERQYRYPVQKTMFEFPAGKCEKGEKKFDGAQRELLEETGYIAKNWAHAGEIYPCIGYSSEVIDVWLAKDLESGKPKLDEGEFVEVFTASLEQIQQWIIEGGFKDGKSIAGLSWLAAYLDKKWEPTWQAGKLRR